MEWFTQLEWFSKTYWVVALIGSLFFLIMLISTFVSGTVDVDMDGDIDIDGGGGFHFFTVKNLYR